MAQDIAGMTAKLPLLSLGLWEFSMALEDCSGLACRTHIGRPLTFLILFVVNIPMTVTLIFLHAPALFTIAMAALMTCYGAGFSLIPPFSDIFGAKELATMHGIF